ncbi:N-acetylglucosamine-6-phosphate deacetylase [Peribacillus butanolivorans]|uniref:N-acetylglucosamine-6-phosphate deacetylase n=1 Tax=Peribacillus butanolivorans TaxID=421767 RepID=UPI00207C9B43|nr:N-acetylglucosamine-6-phosphate deacetylase [Peribacillus butanolivorans]MCO0600012.1 N-acetylglucosamine-6-phosphate deacetylase [Peribacillus butanolivorans]
MEYYIKANRFLLENEEKSGGYLKIINGIFGEFAETIPLGSVVVDWSGHIIAPGLFDTHIHGIKGYDIMDGTTEAVHEISKAILQLGVTRFLPTTLTSSKTDLDQTIFAITEAVRQGLPGAQSEGIFLEGPYFSEQHKGAQNPIYFRDPDYSEFREWQTLSEGQIIKIALAPERENTLNFIEKVSKDGVFVTIAHTEASYECCKSAITAGAQNFVHLFNGMSGLHHRNPGAVGAALMDTRTFSELICDGFHVHPDIATLALRVKGDKLVLITDCMRAGLMPNGEYQLGEFTVVMKDGMARTETGSLAGSTLKLIDGVKNLQGWSNKPLYKIWHSASLSPAASIGKDTKFGSISSGKIADYVVLDEELIVQATAVDGEVRYRRD